MMFVEVSSSHLALSRLDENWMRNQRLKPSRRSLPVGQLGPWQWLRGLRFEIIESHRIIESSPCHHMSSYDISMYPFTVLTRWTHRLRRWTACCGQGQCQPETELCEIVATARTARMSHLWTAKHGKCHKCDKKCDKNFSQAKQRALDALTERLTQLETQATLRATLLLLDIDVCFEL